MAGLFEIGKSGLNSYREALSVTGQNIANINTDGYKRREASLVEVNGASGGITEISSQSGLGVRVENIKRSFDEFLLNKARNARSSSKSVDTYVEKISSLEDILLPGEGNINSAISRLFESFQEVSANPNDIASRSMVIKNAKYLTDVFHQTVSLTNELKKGVSTQAEQAIKDINFLTSNLANVNRNLISSGANSQNALFDNRDAILDELSNYISFSVSLSNNGVASVNLGDTGNGPKLIENDKSFNISSSEDAGILNFFITQGTQSSLTKQITNGKLAGLSDAYYSIINTIDTLDTIAHKLIQDINAIHSEGIDLEGNVGGLFFNNINFDTSPTSSNLGFASAEVEIIDAELIKSKNIIFTYSDTDKLWSAFNENNQLIASGRNKIYLEGMTVSFDGTPASGDTITIKPMENSASAISVAINRPESIAAALPFQIASDISNQNNTGFLVSKAEVETNTSSIPDISTVLSNGHNAIGASSFIRDGAIAIVPAHIDNLDLISLIQQSNIQFFVPDATVNKISNIKLMIDDGVNVAKTYTFDLDNYIDTINTDDLNDEDMFAWTDATKIAELMNIGALKATNNVDIDNNGNPTEFTLSELGGFISGSGSNFNIALNNGDFVSGGVSFTDYPDVEGIVAPRISEASDIQVFTKEGRHIAGSSYESISDLITEENGFYKEAEYRDDYLNLSGDIGYMGTNVNIQNDFSSDLILTTDTETGHIISFDRISDIDSQDSSTDGLKASANVFDYSLTIDNVSFTLNESNVDGDTPAALARAALDEIRNTAPIPSLTGVSSLIETENIVLTNAQKSTLDNEGILSLTYADVNYYLTYENGTYSIKGGPNNQLSLSFDDNTQTISYTYPNLPDDGSSLVISFEGKEYTLTMNDGEIDVTGSENGRLNVSYDDTYTLNISANKGSISASEITIVADSLVSNNSAMGLSFGLISVSSSPTTSYAYNGASYDPTTISGVYTAPNYNFSISENALIIEKDEDYLDDSITITSSVESKVRSRIQLSDLPDEELIIFLTGSNDGNGTRARAISASYDVKTNTDVVLPQNISVKIIDAENRIMEILDTETGTSIATRTLDSNFQSTGLGYNYEFNGELSDGDLFYITNNEGGVFDNRNLKKLIELNDKTKTNENSFQDIFLTLVLDIGTDIQSNKINAEAARALKDSSIEAEAMYSGVNLDSEAAKLIEYQQAYQASARILQTAREIFQTLLETI